MTCQVLLNVSDVFLPHSSADLPETVAENVDTANADGAHGVLVRQPETGFRLEDVEAWLYHRSL